MSYPPYLQVIKQEVTKDKEYIIYFIQAEGQSRSNGKKFSISFEQKIEEKMRTPENMKKLNDSFKSSLQIVKHYGAYTPDGTNEKEMTKMLDKLSSTNMGIGIKIKHDPLPEFKRF